MAISSLKVTGLHERATLTIDLKPNVSLIYGKNGSGKTTILHILANLIDGDFERFHYLAFHRIEVSTFEGAVVILEKERDYDGKSRPRLYITIEGGGLSLQRASVGENDLEFADMIRGIFGGKPVYLPAFRMTLDSATESRAAVRAAIVNGGENAEKEIEKIAQRERAASKRGPGRAGWQYRGRDKADILALKTIMCREWFGKFVPTINHAKVFPRRVH